MSEITDILAAVNHNNKPVFWGAVDSNTSAFLIFGNQEYPHKKNMNIIKTLDISSSRVNTSKFKLYNDYPFLVQTDADVKEVEAILYVSSDVVVSDALLNEVIEFNRNIYTKNKESKNNNNNMIPIPEDTIYIDKKVWNLLISAVRLKKYPLLIGPKGVGKTMTCKTIAKALSMNYYKLNCGTLYKPNKALLGTVHANNGSTYLIKSEFLNYYSSSEPTLIFLDELNRIPSMASNYMMNILEQEDSFIYSEEEGKRYNKGDNVTFIAACNFGNEYVDTRTLDGALADRFIKMPINYLPLNEEVELIYNRLNKICDKESIEYLVSKANSIRYLTKEDVFKTGVSTRQLIDMCSFLVEGYSTTEIIDYIFKNIFLSSGSNDEVEAFMKVINSDE